MLGYLLMLSCRCWRVWVLTSTSRKGKTALFYTEKKEGEKLPYRQRGMQLRAWDLPPSSCQFPSKLVMLMRWYTSSQSTILAKFPFLSEEAIRGWVPLAFWPALNIPYICTLWRLTQVWQGTIASLQLEASPCWVLEPNGAAGHAIPASSHVHQGSHITPTWDHRETRDHKRLMR